MNRSLDRLPLLVLGTIFPQRATGVTMTDFDELYAAFKLEQTQRDALLKLGDMSSFRTWTARLKVETVVIESGERRILSKEETHAELVGTSQGAGAGRQYL